MSQTSRVSRHICILGSTGSIGTQTLEIARQFRDSLQISTLAANTNARLITEQALEFNPGTVILADRDAYKEVAAALSGTSIDVRYGEEAVIEAAAGPNSDFVVAAMVGFAGLKPVLAALEADKTVALANKEVLVVAGELTDGVLKKGRGKILPVDSEHSAIFQCLVGEPEGCIEKLILTASGGPFRTSTMEEIRAASLDAVLDHPNWSMGSKVTVDSASMMNKGLEVMEARWLFDIPLDRIDVLVHPQSIVHSMVEFVDGSYKAQLGVPDMRVPIQYAITYPDRWPSDNPRLDWSTIACLDFESPDLERFPCLRLAREAAETGGHAPAILNAANETAVSLLLDGKIAFYEIPGLISHALEHVDPGGNLDLDTILATDEEARAVVKELKPIPNN